MEGFSILMLLLFVCYVALPFYLLVITRDPKCRNCGEKMEYSGYDKYICPECGHSEK